MDTKPTPTRKSCIVCGSTSVSVFLQIRQVPVHCNLLWSTYHEALQARRADICLGFCRVCGHVFNLAFQPEVMKYDQQYENTLHFSVRFKEYAKTLAEQLIARHELHNKRIIEIGCGKGDFLALLCQLGQNHGTGFDPSYDPKREENVKQENITFVKDFYSRHYADFKADFICCRHVLEHIEAPRRFLSDIYTAIKDQSGTVVFFEVPNAKFTFEDLGIWDLIYEHCSYFCMRSLKYLFTSCSFKVSDCTETFGGQFLNIEAVPITAQTNSDDKSRNDTETISDFVATFADRYHKTVKQWQQKIQEFQASGKRAVIWGAGSKGVTFLNVLAVKKHIKYAVDVNPHKQGKHIAGAGQEIVPPDFLREYRPDVIVVMNPIYQSEIQQVVNNLGVKPEIVLA